MKYFAISHVGFSTAVINRGEYFHFSGHDSSDYLRRASRLVSDVLELDATSVVAALRVYLTDGIYAAPVGLTPNEERCLLEFIEMASHVVLSMKEDGTAAGSRTCVIANLNTGRTFTWAHIVC